jgi:hypothetical protein
MAQIRISRAQSWIFLWEGVCYLHLGQTRCFGLRTVRASCCKRNISRKTLWKMRNRNFRLFWDDFVLGCMEGLDIKCRSFVRDPSFLPALHTPQLFSGFLFTNDLSLIMSSLDSWLDGASAGYRVDYVQHNISGIKSNNLLYFRQVWRLLEKL